MEEISVDSWGRKVEGNEEADELVYLTMRGDHTECDLFTFICKKLLVT